MRDRSGAYVLNSYYRRTHGLSEPARVFAGKDHAPGRTQHAARVAQGIPRRAAARLHQAAPGDELRADRRQIRFGAGARFADRKKKRSSQTSWKKKKYGKQMTEVTPYEQQHIRCQCTPIGGTQPTCNSC